MARNYQQYLDAHEGNAEEALRAAVRDVAQRESQNTAARAFKRAYAPLVESLKLPVDVDTDTEQEAQTLAARALDGLSKDGAAQTLADVYAAALKAAGIDPDALLDRLQKLPEGASGDERAAAIAEHVKPVKDAAGRALELERKVSITEAAQALGKPADALAEILEGKTLEKRTVKGADGGESEQWGILQGDTFRPLSELRSIQLLAPAQPDKPAPAPLPTGQRGGNARPVDPVQARIEARKAAGTPVDLLATPAPTQGGF